MPKSEQTRPKKHLVNVRITPGEHATLRAAAETQGRTQTDLLREMIRALAAKTDEKEPAGSA